MDNQFLIRQNMNREELDQFAQSRLQREQGVEEYMLKREERLGMSAEGLKALYAKEVVSPVKVQPDMPKLNADEKEWKQKRRQKNRLKDQVKELEKNHKERVEKFDSRGEKLWEGGNPDAEAMAMFEQTIDATKLSPQYVLEHFVEVRQMLDDWKGHLRLFGINGIGSDKLTMEQEFRISLMRQMYQQSERAFQSALAAIGFRYEESERGGGSILDIVTEEEKNAALTENMRLREEIGQAVTMDDKVADQLIASEQEVLHADSVQMQEDMSKDPRFAFIKSDHLCNLYQYQGIEELKRLIERFPQPYAAHKAEIDRMYEEFFHLMEVNGVYQEPSTAITSIQFDRKKVSSEKVRRILQHRLDVNKEKMRMMRERADCIKAGIKHLLRGDALTETESLVVREYTKPQDQREQERHEAEAQAGTYADIYREKKAIFVTLAEDMFGDRAEKIISGEAGRFMMFMEPGQQEHNEAIVKSLLTLENAKTFRRAISENKSAAIKKAGSEEEKNAIKEAANEEEKIVAKSEGEAMKPLVIPYLEMVMQADVSKYATMSDEELIAQNEELQELYISGMQVSDMAKYTDPDDPEGRSIKAAFCQDNAPLFAMKCALLQYYAVKARMLAMVQAYGKGSLTKECFTGREQEKIRLLCDLKDQDEISMTHMLAYVRDILKRNEPSRDAAYTKYFNDEQVKAKVAKQAAERHNLETTHPDYLKRLEEVEAEGKVSLKKKAQLNASELQELYQHKMERITEIRKELEEPDEMGIRTLQLQAELEPLEEQAESLQILAALSRSGYSMVDNGIFNEAIFRSYLTIDSIPSFRDMSEEEFGTMCRQLSAGYMQKETATPEEIEQYRAENVQGLLTYKEHMSEHYEMLERRFHHQVPPVEYVQEHYDEVRNLFANIQVDTNLVQHSRDMIDLTNPADLRLYHLVMVYNAIGLYILNLTMFAASMGYTEARQGSQPVLRKEQASFDYLNQEHAQPEQEQLTAQFTELSQTVETRRQEADQREREARKGMNRTFVDMKALRDRYKEMSGSRDSQDFKAVGEVFSQYISMRRVVTDVDGYKIQLQTLQAIKEAVSRYNASHSGKRRTQKGIDRMELMQDLNAQIDVMIGQVHNMIDIVQQKQEQKGQQDAALEKLESQLKADRFRQLAADAATILQANPEAQISFVGRVEELKAYVSKYEGVTSPHMEQIRAWYEQVQKKCPVIAKKLCHSVEEVQGNVDVLRDANTLKAEYESGDPARVLEAGYRMCRALSVIQEASVEEAREMEENKKYKEFSEIEYTYGIEKTETMTKESQEELLRLFYEKKEEFANRLQDEITRMRALVPEHLPEEEKEGFAIYLACKTETGLAYDAYTVFGSRYFRNEPMINRIGEFLQTHEELMTRMGQLDQKIVDAKTKFGKRMEGTGFEEQFASARFEKVREIFKAEA